MEQNRKKKIIIITAAIAAVALIAVICVVGNKNSSTPRVCLDAGHGGDDVGAIFEDRYEKDDNLRLALAVGEVLEENGIKVIYTRKTDKTVALEKRAEIANRAHADYFVSLHRNSAASQASGVEIWVKSNADFVEKSMARNILNEIMGVGFGANRGVRAGHQTDPGSNYLVNAATDMPSCLVEMGFMTTPGDNSLFDSRLEAYAAAIAAGIMKNL